MIDPTILPVKPGSLNKRDKSALRKAGVIVIEHDDPSSIRLLRPAVEIDSSDLLRCAMRALVSDSSWGRNQRETFAKLVAESVNSKPAPTRRST